MSEPERLRETLALLERVREEERAGRLHAERIIDALIRFTERGTLAEIHLVVTKAFRDVILAEAALLIEFGEQGSGAAIAATEPRLAATTWEQDGVFKRALLRGKPVAVFSADEIAQWRQQPADVTAGIGSLLLVPLVGGDFSTLLVLLHRERAFFDASHLGMAGRLIPPAIMALSHARSEQAERELRLAVEQQREQLRAELAERTRLEEELRKTRETFLMREIEEKAALIDHQRSAIRALQNPIIEVWAGILCLPIIGALDQIRSQQLASDLLSAVQDFKARAVILDVTGLDQMDAALTGHFVRIVESVRLLGARCVITGISADLAASLVSQSLDISRVSTFRRVRDALLYLCSPSSS